MTPDNPAPPAGPVHWRTPGTLLWGAAIAVMFVFVQTFALGFAAAVRHPKLSQTDAGAAMALTGEDGFFVSFATFATTLLCGLAIIIAIKCKKGARVRDYLCLRPISGKILATWAGILVIYVAIADGLTVLLGRPVVPEFMSNVYATAEPVWLLWLALVVAAPLFEEMFFRGFLFTGLAGGFLRPAGAAVATAGLWTVVHVQYDAFLLGLVFVFGLLLGAARIRTGSLYVPLALHAAGNLIATVETALLG